MQTNKRLLFGHRSFNFVLFIFQHPLEIFPKMFGKYDKSSVQSGGGPCGVGICDRS